MLVVDLCPRTPPFRRRLLQRRRGAWEIRVPGADADCGLHRRHLKDGTCAGFVDGRYGFLLRRLSRGGVPDLEFDSVSGGVAQI